MTWQLTEDVADYLAAAGGFLRANAARNTIQLSAAETARAEGSAAFGDAAPLYGWWTGPGAAFAAAWRAAPQESRQVVNNRLGFGGLVLWEDAGVPVSLAARTRTAGGQARVGPVYTPPDRRGRGYGAGVTAAVTQAALDGGGESVVLFTDLDNPTSNTLYQRLGYRPVTDWAVLTFLAPNSGS